MGVVMKKILLLFILVLFISFGVSCGSKPSPREMITDFLRLYGAEGQLYFSDARPGEYGYVEPELYRGVFLFSGEMPKSFALYLNSHADYGSECGVFVFHDGAERQRIIEACKSRCALVSQNSRYLLICSDKTVFYSTMSDEARAGEIWRKILGSYY